MVGSFADDDYSFKGGDEMLVTAVTRSAELTRTESERQRQESEVQVSNQALEGTESVFGWSGKGQIGADQDTEGRRSRPEDSRRTVGGRRGDAAWTARN